jgi:hypothetical protein
MMVSERRAKLFDSIITDIKEQIYILPYWRAADVMVLASGSIFSVWSQLLVHYILAK